MIPRAAGSCTLNLLALALVGACSDPAPDSTGPTWKAAFDASDTGWLLSVWGNDPNDVYTVGGSESEGVLMHFDGKDWSSVELEQQVPLLTWVHGFATDDITAVGNEGTVLHYDGNSWRSQPTPTQQNLWGVWGSAPDDLWAVGGRGRAEGEATLLHFDGSDWQAQPLPDLERTGVNALFKVWGTAADNVYAVGQRGAVIHFDGHEWSEQLVGASDDLISIWGTDADHIVAVGGRASGIVSVFDGSAWTTESLAPLPGLNGVWLGQGTPAYLVGGRGTAIALDTGSFDYVDDTVDIELDLHGVFGIEHRLFTVGGNFMSSVPPYRGIALQRNLEEP